MLSIKILEAATLEAEEAAAWYEARRAGLGREFREAFKALDRLNEERCPAR